MKLIEHYNSGYKRGKEVVETIYKTSSNFSTSKDPLLKTELRRKGISSDDIGKLMVKPTLNPEKVGHMIAGLVFFCRKGTIWNSDDMKMPHVINIK
jgi:hypothetical protein